MKLCNKRAAALVCKWQPQRPGPRRAFKPQPFNPLRALTQYFFYFIYFSLSIFSIFFIYFFVHNSHPALALFAPHRSSSPQLQPGTHRGLCCCHRRLRPGLHVHHHDVQPRLARERRWSPGSRTTTGPTSWPACKNGVFPFIRFKPTT